jgi:hypothetical protein
MLAEKAKAELRHDGLMVFHETKTQLVPHLLVLVFAFTAQALHELGLIPA